MKNPINSKSYFKILFFITAIAIFILATVSNDHIVINSSYADKIKHITAFFVLSLLLNRSSSSAKTRLRNIIALLFFGFFIEFSQYFIAGREADLMDIVADFIGIMIFQVGYAFFKLIQSMNYKAKVKPKRL